MKITKKLLSVFIAMILLLGLAGAVGYAEGVSIPEEATLRIEITYDYIEEPGMDEMQDPGMTGDEMGQLPEGTPEGEVPMEGMPDEGMPEAGMDTGMGEVEMPVSVITVTVPNEQPQNYVPGDPIPVKALLDQEAVISILPPEEAYISTMSFGTETLMTHKAVIADPAGAMLSVKLSELLLEDGISLDGTFVPKADAEAGSLTLQVTCSELEDTPATVQYSAGLLPLEGSLVDNPTANTVQAPSEAVIHAARAAGFDFDSYTLTYVNGASVDVVPGASLAPCLDAFLVANWKTYEAPSAPPVIPEDNTNEGGVNQNQGGGEQGQPTTPPMINDGQPSAPPQGGDSLIPGGDNQGQIIDQGQPSTPPQDQPSTPPQGGDNQGQNQNPPPQEQPSNPPVPTYNGPDFVLKVDDQTKAFDASYAQFTWSTEPADLQGYEVKNVVINGNLILPISIDVNISSYEVYDPEGNKVDPKLLEGHVTLQSGHIEITKRPMTVTAVSTQLATKGETKYAADVTTIDGSFTNGYSVSGLLPGMELRGDFVTGSGKESFDTGIDLSKLHVCVIESDMDVTVCFDITAVPGRIEITDTTPTERPAETTPPPTTSPSPTVSPSPTPSASINNPLIITARSSTWTYDGQPHNLLEYDARGLVDNDRIYSVQFDRSSTITNVGEQDNVIVAAEVRDASGQLVPDNKYAKIFRVGKLYVEKRYATITAISGSLAATGEERYASRLSTPDGSYTNGYHVDGLVKGQQLAGDFVYGSGKTTFQTGIDLNRMRVIDNYGYDVTNNYAFRTISGQINIVQQQTQSQTTSSIPVTVTAKSNTWTYDGTAHTLEQYDVTGLQNGDVIDKAVFKSTSSITDVGTKANEIQSVVIKSATGAAIDSSKYSIRYVSGTLTVTKFPLTLTAVSDSKVYDGKALNNKSVKSSSLANASHKLSADYEVYDSNGNTIKNGPVDPGTYVKKVSNVKITAGNQDVTANYEIKTEDGTLTITGTASSTAAGKTSSETSTAYYGSTFTVRSDAPYTEFLYLMVDGQRVAGENYTVREGSTIVTMKASFIQDLKKGPHNYSIVSQNKTVDGSFTVAKSPRTAEGGGSPVLWIILLVAAALLVLVAVYFLKRGGNGGRPGSDSGKGGSPRGTSTGSRSGSRTGSSPARGAGSQPSRARAASEARPSVSRQDFDRNSDHATRTGYATGIGISSNSEEMRQNARSRAYSEPAPAPARPQAPRYEAPVAPEEDIVSSVMNARPVRQEEEPDPTADLMKGFSINPDEFRKGSPAPAAGVTAPEAQQAPVQSEPVVPAPAEAEPVAPMAEASVQASAEAVQTGVPAAEPVSAAENMNAAVNDAAHVEAEAAPTEAQPTEAQAEPKPEAAPTAEPEAPAKAPQGFDPFASLAAMRDEARAEAKPAPEKAPLPAAEKTPAPAPAKAPAEDTPAEEEPPARAYRGRHEAR